MRIALDYQTFAQQTYGGISRYFTRLAENFIICGEQVKIFAPLHVNAYLKSLTLDTISGRHIKRFPPKTKRFFLTYNRLTSSGKIKQWQPDVVHETYYSKYRTAPKKYPLVITVYDMIHEMFDHEFPARDQTAAIKKIAIARADHVICISENTKKDLVELHGISEDKISVVLLGFDQFTNHPKFQQPLETKPKPFLLYVGSRGGYKNFAGFLKSVAISKNLRSDFDVLAFGGGKFTPAELAYIANLGFSSNQVRQVSGDDSLLGHYYTTARAFVYPSQYEGFGIPPLEAMAHRCPVVSSNTSSMPEVIGHAGEYFNPMNTTEMQHAIESVVYSDSRIAELRAMGTARLAHFSWATCAKQTLAVYRNLL